jgi:hypothetical protein
MKYCALPLAIVAATVIVPLASSAALPPPACADQAYRGMDYAIGTWIARDAKNNVLGKGEWAKSLGGCVIHFTWQGRRYSGDANNAYDASRRLWQKAFFSNTGEVELSEGHVVAGTMVYMGLDYDKGKAVQMHREKLLRLPDGRLNFHYEMSEDHGKTWKLAGNAFYTRVDRATFDATAL